MTRTIITSLALGLFAIGCDPAEPGASPSDDLGSHANRRTHFVSVGGADFCDHVGFPTGCDGNFSLIAYQSADGTVGGEWEDAFGFGAGYVHVAVDCLAVEGDQAWISGIITQGNIFGTDLTGLPAITTVVDNGTSWPDPFDQISWTTPEPFDCADMPELELMDLYYGQVTVR